MGGEYPARPFAILTVALLCFGQASSAACLDPDQDLGQTHRDRAPQPTFRDLPGTREPLSGVDGYFTENLGQLGAGAGAFYCQGSPLSVALGPGWASYHHASGDGDGVMVRVDFGGAAAVAPQGRDALSHPTNFLKGDDPEGWVVGARSYREVVYEDAWEGVDLVWRFADGSLKYDLMVDPWADLSAVALRYSGHEDLRVESATGDLVIATPLVDLVDSAPVTFQAGEVLASRFVLLDDRTVAFEVEGRDPSLPLVVDPGLTFSTYIGGSGFEMSGIMVDDAGDIYMGGMSDSTDFPTTPGVVYEEAFPDMDAIVLKLKGDGSELLFSTFIGSPGYDGIFDVAVDPDGNVVIAGFTNNTTFPRTAGAFQTRWGGLDEGFVMKLNTNCSEILWSTLLGGVVDDGCYYVEVFPNGSILVGGLSGSNDFPMVWGCFDTSYNGFFEAFLTILDPTGSKVLRSTYFGGDYYEDLMGMVLVTGDNGGVYLTLKTQSDNLPVSKDAFRKHRAGNIDAAVVKLDLSLTHMLYSTYIGGYWNEIPRDLAVDDEGCAYVIGDTSSTDFPTTPGAMSRSYHPPGDWDAFLAKVSPDGSSLEWSSYLGGNQDDYGAAVYWGKDGLVRFLLSTKTDFLPVTEHALQGNIHGDFDIYMGVLDGENQTIRYATYLGGIDEESNTHMVEGPDGSVVITTYTYSNNYPTTLGAYDISHNGDWDIAVSRWDALLSDPVPPGPPIDLKAWRDFPSVQLEWGLPETSGDFDLLEFRLYRGDSATNMSLLEEIPRYVTNWTDSPSEFGKTYHYTLTAYSPAGESGWSNVVNVTLATCPDPPVGFKAEPLEGGARLSWSAPAFTGWRPLEGYHLYRGTEPTTLGLMVSLGMVEGYIDEDVSIGYEYHYALCAHNGELNSSLTPVLSVVPQGPPTAPIDLKAIAGDRSVSLSWGPPENSGGSIVTVYDVLRGTSPDSLSPLRTVGGRTTQLSDEDLVNGVTYYYTVIAYNEHGNSTWSRVVSATPRGPPGTPLSFEAHAGDGRVDLSWQPPDDDGGLPIEGYTVLRGISLAHMAPLKQLPASTSHYSDTGLVNGKTLFYAISARNALGDGPATLALEVTPIALPDAPGNLVAESGRGFVTLTWTAPMDDGGSAVTDYIIYRGSSADALELLLSVQGTVRTHCDNQVVAGTEYHYALSARTAVGEGPRCTVVSAMPYGPPGIPLDLVVIAGDREVAIFWGPPESDGGKPVTGYVLYRGGDVTSLSELVRLPVGGSFLDTAVVNGETYHYAITAINVAGEGERTGPINATPSAPARVPGTVGDLTLDLSGTTVDLHWSPPVDDGGSIVTGYLILRGLSPDTLETIAEVGPGETSYSDGDLDRGSTYFYSVVARNGVGEGQPFPTREVTVPMKGSDSPGFEALAAIMVMLVMVPIIRRRR